LRRVRVLISAGEPSGELIARLLEYELTRQPEIAVQLLDAGRSLGPVFGFGAGLRVGLRLGRAVESALAEIENARPDVVVLVAFSGFHLALGRRTRARGIPVLFLSPPQVWAWGGWRARQLRSAADKVVCLFGFEQPLLQLRGIDAVYCGYPLLDSVHPNLSDPQVRLMLGLGREPYVAFLPGSRETERGHHVPLFKQVFELVRSGMPGLRGVMVGETAGLSAGMAGTTSERYSVIARAACVLAVSGTVTAEAAILGTPMVVCYHLSRFSTLAARLLVRTWHFALPNILVRERIVPEFLNPTAPQLAAELLSLIRDQTRQEKMREGLARVRESLGPTGALPRIAREVVGLARLD
jgi:lipid-A-disaccharide synthase